jgi:hypothetical protein
MSPLPQLSQEEMEASTVSGYLSSDDDRADVLESIPTTPMAVVRQQNVEKQVVRSGLRTSLSARC